MDFSLPIGNYLCIDLQSSLMLLYPMDGLLLTTSQLTQMNSVHLKRFRRIFKIKSSHYHGYLTLLQLNAPIRFLQTYPGSSRRDYFSLPVVLSKPPQSMGTSLSVPRVPRNAGYFYAISSIPPHQRPEYGGPPHGTLGRILPCGNFSKN